MQTFFAKVSADAKIPSGIVGNGTGSAVRCGKIFREELRHFAAITLRVSVAADGMGRAGEGHQPLGGGAEIGRASCRERV